MMAQYLSALWTALAAALGNHLWQSTLFATTAGLLTLSLRRNYARARYWLWLAASMKFLAPFSLLVSLGNYLAWSRGSAGTKGGLYFAMEQVSQPFNLPTLAPIPPTAPSAASPGLADLIPALLIAAWLCGFVVVVLLWYVRWRRVSGALREAAPLREGRELEALRRLESKAGIGKRIEIFLSRASLEPGIFGIVRPVLVWPEGISERLGDAHLEAILAHELWHVRRRDNLAAVIHMVVEAVFWFHPLVWWLGSRLVDERERACDEEVLEMGGDRQVYAESILKVCAFCVGSPLACVSGVTGADLNKRMVEIMNEGIVRKLDFSRKLLLSATGLAVIGVPIVFGLLKATPSRAESPAQNTGASAPAYESVSIKTNKTGEPMPPFHIIGKPALGFMFKPGQFLATNATLHQLIRRIYNVQDDQISGGPSWLNSENYDVNVKMDKSVMDEQEKLSQDQQVLEQKRIVQGILADRFKLTMHREPRTLLVLALVIAQNGPKLQEAKPGETYVDGLKRPNGQPLGPVLWGPAKGQLVSQGQSMAALADYLSRQLGGRIVVDKTALMGKFDFTVHWSTQDDGQGAANKTSPDSPGPSFFTAMEEQLGLKLEPQTAPVEVLVIDHAEKPSEN